VRFGLPGTPGEVQEDQAGRGAWQPDLNPAGSPSRSQNQMPLARDHGAADLLVAAPGVRCRLVVALPRPPGRPVVPSRRPVRTPGQGRCPGLCRPRRRHPATAARDARPRPRRRPGLSRQNQHPSPQRGRQSMEPIRRRRSRKVTTTPGRSRSSRQLITRARQVAPRLPERLPGERPHPGGRGSPGGCVRARGNGGPAPAARFQPRRTSGVPAKARPRDKAAHSSVPRPAATRENAAQVNGIHLQATMYTPW
jgi:hypothetical protein